ncbi:hypothetical protein TRFO_29788 [Tritrichomonas foetus]|uniref:Uncharacterized protein n=1 Tax=Tritrichomonas foetus TaxID=1144522 RepID=A0A1J4JZK7_9EUKA|nr:hypothetical protein TRFO_29788 [Tritrichomonas foetus]|eukprot:OHT02964.1 hypothetical protein TRFO_29788 [Tritrichomonas foetus]
MFSPEKIDFIEQQENQRLYQNTYHFNDDDTDTRTNENPVQVNTNAVADLERLLTKSTQPFSTMAITSVKELFFEVGIENVTNEQVQYLFNRLPRIEHLEYHQSTFELFSFLCNEAEFAKKLYDSQILESINFASFEIVQDETKTFISDMINKIVNEVPESLTGLFIDKFFPYFYNFIIDQNFYRSDGLDAHLLLASKFLPELEDEKQIRNIFSRFTLFVEHTRHDVIHASLQGLLLAIRSFDWILNDQSFSEEKFINRLHFLGMHQIEQTGVLVLVLFEHILKNNDIELPLLIYTKIYTTLRVYLSLTNIEMRNEAIILLGFAFSNQYFRIAITTETEDGELFVHRLMETFLTKFDSFKLKEKKSSVYAFANFLGYMPIDIITAYINLPIFFNEILQILEFDDPEIILPLLYGLYTPLNGGNMIINSDENKDMIINALKALAQSDDEKLSQSAIIVSKALSQ